METNRSVAEGCRSQRRKFTDAHDLLLLKEVVGSGVHLAKHGETLKGFAQVAEALNSSGGFPWPTDCKHVQDRFKLLITSWRRLDRKNAAASGREEEFGEMELLLHNISEDMDDAEREKETANREIAARERALRDAGAVVREKAMARRGSALESNSDDSSTPRPKRAKFEFEVGRSLKALEEADDRFEETEKTRALLDEKRLEVEQKRLDIEVAEVEHRRSIETRRMILEEKRFEADQAKAADEREERKLSMKLQLSMIEMMKNMNG
jgi:hypothetical protein